VSVTAERGALSASPFHIRGVNLVVAAGFSLFTSDAIPSLSPYQPIKLAIIYARFSAKRDTLDTRHGLGYLYLVYYADKYGRV